MLALAGPLDKTFVTSQGLASSTAKPSTASIQPSQERICSHPSPSAATHEQRGLRHVQLQQVLVVTQLGHVVGRVGGAAVAQAAGAQRAVDATAGMHARGTVAQVDSGRVG